jgi:hypothetical protein
MTNGRREFGCAECNIADAAAAWENTRQLERASTLVDDSHFIFQVLRCKQCGQPFLWITTEIVDWAGGDDAQYRRVIPLTEIEAGALIARDGEPDPDELRPFADGRRYLHVDWPTGAEEPTASWTTGPLSFVTADV